MTRRLAPRLRRAARHPDAAVLVLVVTAMLLPPWWASVAAVHGGWWPDRDDAQIAMRALDVLHGHLQLVGARSTSGLVGPELSSHHPGPIEFYLLALPLAVSGGLPVGIVVGTALIHTVALLWIARASWLLGGLRLLVPMAGASLVVAFATGNGNLFRPLNTGPPTYFLLLLPLAAVVALSGRPWWMMVYAFSATLVMQGQLAYVPSVALLTAIVLGLGIAEWHRKRGTWWPRPGRRRQGSGHSGWLTVLLLTVLWAPPAVESLTAHPGNATQLWRYLLADKSAAGGSTTSPASFLLHYLAWPVPLPLPYAVRALLTIALLVGVLLLARADVAALGDARDRAAAVEGSVVRRITLLTVAAVPIEVICLLVLLPSSTNIGTPDYWLTPLIAAGASVWAVAAWLMARRVRRMSGLPSWAAPLSRLSAVAPLLWGAATMAAAIVVCLTNVTYASTENRVLTDAAAVALRGVESQVEPGTPVKVTSGGTSTYFKPVAGTAYRLMTAGIFACADLPWPLPESTDFRTWSGCPPDSPIVVAVLNDEQASRPKLDGSWKPLGRTSSYVSASGQARWFELYLVTPPS